MNTPEIIEEEIHHIQRTLAAEGYLEDSTLRTALTEAMFEGGRIQRIQCEEHKQYALENYRKELREKIEESKEKWRRAEKLGLIPPIELGIHLNSCDKFLALLTPPTDSKNNQEK
jgi:hypothetical protein